MRVPLLVHLFTLGRFSFNLQRFVLGGSNVLLLHLDRMKKAPMSFEGIQQLSTGKQHGLKARARLSREI